MTPPAQLIGKTVTLRRVWLNEIQSFPVRVMAVAEGWAMVRRKGAMPFVCSVKDLVPPEIPTSTKP